MKENEFDKIIQNLSDEVINNIQEIIDIIDKYKLQDRQWVIDWFDKLNEQSVTH